MALILYARYGRRILRCWSSFWQPVLTIFLKPHHFIFLIIYWSLLNTNRFLMFWMKHSRSCLRVKLNLLLNIVILMFIFLCQRFSIFIQIIMKSLSIPVMAARHSVFLFILLQRILMIHAFYSVTVESCWIWTT